MEKISGKKNLNVAIQIIPLQIILQRTKLTVLKEIAFSVYTKIKRITLEEKSKV